MTIESTVFRTDWMAADGATKNWPYEFTMLAQSHARVETKVGVDGEITKTSSDLALFPTDLTEGFVQYPVVAAALPVGTYIRISREVPYTQPTEIGNEGSFNPELHEETFDLLEMQIQQNKDLGDRAIKVREGDMGFEVTPGLEGEILVFDANGNLVPHAGLTDSEEAMAAAVLVAQGHANAAEGFAVDADTSETNAASSALAAQNALNQIMAAIPNVFVNTRADMKAITDANITAAYLKEPGREGQFIKLLGNYTAEVAGDTLEGLFIPFDSDGVPGTSGAWVRVVSSDEYDFRWFGALDDSTVGPNGTDNTAKVLPAFKAIKLHGGNTLVIPPHTATDVRAITAAGDALNMRMIDRSGYTFDFGSVPYQMSEVMFQYTDISGAGHAYNGNTFGVSGYYHPAYLIESLDPPGLPGSKASIVWWSQGTADWQMAYNRTTEGFEAFEFVSYGPDIAGTTKFRIGGQRSPHFGQFNFNYSAITGASYAYGQAGKPADADYLTRGITSYYSLPSGSSGDIQTLYRLGTALIGRDIVQTDGTRKMITESGHTITTDNIGRVSGMKRPVAYAQSGTTNLIAAQSGTVVSNLGAAGPVTVNLPAAEIGLEFFFSIDASQMLTINPSGTNNISGGGAGQDYQSNNAGAALHLVAISATRWMALSDGTWTFV